jgi:hypothetical protein
VPGSGAQKRSHAQAIRCYNLRQEGFTLSQIADIVCIDKEKVRDKILLGERLVSLGGENGLLRG